MNVVKENELEDGEIEDGEIEDEDTEMKEEVSISPQKIDLDLIKENKLPEKHEKTDAEKVAKKERKKEKKLKKSKRKKNDDDSNGSDNEKETYNSHLAKNLLEAADDDEFEFLYVRGASPSLETKPTNSYWPQTRYSNNKDIDTYSNSSNGSVDSYEKLRKDDKKYRKANRTRKHDGEEFDDKYRKRRRRETKDPDKVNVETERTMELCKFYIQDNCVKLDDCGYMHSDFPCKFYYLGMPCKANENGICKYMHGSSLSDKLKSILTKHIECAPTSILGDFPRYNREQITKMINATNTRLIIEQIKSKQKAIAEQYKDVKTEDTNIVTEQKMEEVDKEKKRKRKKSRWDNSTSYFKHLDGLISNDQIQKLEEMGINTVDEFNQLTIGQLNNLNISILELQKIQQALANIEKPENTESTNTIKQIPETFPTANGQILPIADFGDMDMRIPPTLQTNHILPLPGQDVDMRVPPISSLSMLPPSIVPINNVTNNIIKPNSPNSQSETNSLIDEKSIKYSPPTFDYSKYLSESNLGNYSDDDQTDEDEMGLKINCEVNEDTDKKFIKLYQDSDSNSSEKVIIEQNEKHTNEIQNDEANTINNRNIFYVEPEIEEKTDEVDVFKDIRKTIYDTVTDGGHYDEDRLKGDTDHRFKAILNYAPATEIDASITSHNGIDYKLHEIDIPAPDYSSLKKNVSSMNKLDPRVRRIVGLRVAEDSYDNMVADKAFSTNIPTRSDPRNRLKKEEKLPELPILPQFDLMATNSITKNVDFQKYLQKSAWYRDLSSKQKITVNQNLAMLSAELKKFHLDPNPNKKFETISSVKQALSNLDIYINFSGEIVEVPPIENQMNIIPSLMDQEIQIPNPIQDNIGYNSNENFPQQFFNVRPGILGFAPNIPNLPNNFYMDNQGMNSFPINNAGNQNRKPNKDKWRNFDDNRRNNSYSQNRPYKNNNKNRNPRRRD